MSTVLDRLANGSRISVIRLRSLGDCVLTTPALALLKAHRPDLKIRVAVESRFAAVFQNSPDVDETAQSVGPADLVLNFHGGTRSMWMTAASFAKHRIGFAHHRYSFVYTHQIPRAQEILSVDRKVHTAEHLASAMFWLGVPRAEIPRAKLAASPIREASPYAVIHPFAATPEKTWPAEKFLAIADRLRASGLEPYFLAGPGDATSAFAQYRTRSSDLAGVKNLLAGAQIFIGNDSGPAHIAAAFGVPVIVLFGPSDPVIWAPWRTESRVLASPDGIDRIPVDQVLRALDELQVRLNEARV